MANCKICNVVLNSPRAKVCDSNTCKSKWKLQRNSFLAAKTLECRICGKSYKTQDPRQKTCSLQCRTSARHSTNLQKYGKKSLTGAKNPEATSTQMRNMWATNGPAVEAKRKATLQARYGVNSPFALEGVDERRRASLFKNHGVNSPLQHTTAVKAGFTNYEEFAKAIVSLIEQHQLPPFSDSFLEIIRTQYGLSSQVVDTAISHLDRRDLLRQFRSAQETEIHNFITGLGLAPEANVRPEFMCGLELDLYLPEQKFAVEFHGLAHHSDRPIFGPKDSKKVRTLHRQKYELCAAAGVTLVQIFEDEWREKRPLLEAMLASRLARHLAHDPIKRLNARDCTIKPVEVEDRKTFFAANHVAGDTHATKTWGLYKDEVLVAALSVRKPWILKEGEKTLEIARFASLPYHQVVGGLSKLLAAAKQYAVAEQYTQILTYADLRFGSGGAYAAVGMVFKGYTTPNYFYEREGVRENRFKHRKRHTPEALALGSTERAQAEAEDFFAIYDAGSAIYVLSLGAA